MGGVKYAGFMIGLLLVKTTLPANTNVVKPKGRINKIGFSLRND